MKTVINIVFLLGILLLSAQAISHIQFLNQKGENLPTEVTKEGTNYAISIKGNHGDFATRISIWVEHQDGDTLFIYQQFFTTDQILTLTQFKVTTQSLMDHLKGSNIVVNDDEEQYQMTNGGDFSFTIEKNGFITISLAGSSYHQKLTLFTKEKVSLEQENKKLKQQIATLKMELANCPAVPLFIPNPFQNQFSTNNNEITYLGADSQWVQQLVEQDLTTKNTFSIKILKSKFSQIHIGIADRIYSNAKFSATFLNNIHYVGFNANLVDGGFVAASSPGIGFSEGHIVKVVVDFALNKITWYVNGVLQVSRISAKISDPLVQWVPYLALFNNGDSVEWL